MKKIMRNIAIGLTVLWLIFLGFTVHSYLTYEPAPGASGMELLDGAILGMFCIFAAAGACCSGMLAVAMHRFRNAWYDSLKGAARALLIVAVWCNVLLYLTLVFLKMDSILLIPVGLAWVLSMPVCFLLLLGDYSEEPDGENPQ